MTPLQLAIALGRKDTELSVIIRDLYVLKQNGGLSLLEEETLKLAICRLEHVMESASE